MVIRDGSGPGAPISVHFEQLGHPLDLVWVVLGFAGSAGRVHIEGNLEPCFVQIDRKIVLISILNINTEDVWLHPIKANKGLVCAIAQDKRGHYNAKDTTNRSAYLIMPFHVEGGHWTRKEVVLVEESPNLSPFFHFVAFHLD